MRLKRRTKPTMWHTAAQNRLAHEGLTVAEAKKMSDRDLLRIPNIGKHQVQLIREWKL
jgi:hypothetical protein